MRPSCRLAGIVALVIVPAVCSGYVLVRDRGSAAERAPERAAIAMEGTAFVPKELRVSVGQTVTWINKDPFPHNVSSGTGGFSSRDLQPDEEWRFTPSAAGRFPYVCTLHPGMKGTLVVSKP